MCIFRWNSTHYVQFESKETTNYLSLISCVKFYVTMSLCSLSSKYILLSWSQWLMVRESYADLFYSSSSSYWGHIYYRFPLFFQVILIENPCRIWDNSFKAIKKLLEYSFSFQYKYNGKKKVQNYKLSKWY